MKRLCSFIFAYCILFSTPIEAQIPQGNRTLAWQVDMAEDMNYEAAFGHAADACMESIHIFYTWSAIEPDAGNFDQVFIANTLDVMNIFYPAFNTKVELQLAVTNTVQREVPFDLQNTNFAHMSMRNRFKTLIDTVFAHIPNVELAALTIGNESDLLFGSDPVHYSDFKEFLDDVAQYARERWLSLHGVELKVGTTLTLHGLTTPPISNLCALLNANMDIVAATYYPLNSDFTMQEPTAVINDFSALVSQYSNTSKPIYIVECGYASSSTCNSSEELQAGFFHYMFEAWDTHADKIQYLTIFKSTDWSMVEVEALGQYYGFNDIAFLEYLRTLGVRTWPGSGAHKVAYEQIRCELEARNWCGTDCILSANGLPHTSSQPMLYPNPAGQYVFIADASPGAVVQFYATTGVSLRKSSDKKLYVGDLPSGMYILTIAEIGQVPNVLRFVKQ